MMPTFVTTAGTVGWLLCHEPPVSSIMTKLASWELAVFSVLGFSATVCNSSWPSDAIRWHRTRSKLVQVMACCLQAPTHYLNQWWMSLDLTDDKSTLIQVMDWCRQAPIHYLNQCRPIINKVKAPIHYLNQCRLIISKVQAPTHYLNQCRLIISKIQWHSSKDNSTRDTQPSITKISLKIIFRKYLRSMLTVDRRRERESNPGMAGPHLAWLNYAHIIQAMYY